MCVRMEEIAHPRKSICFFLRIRRLSEREKRREGCVCEDGRGCSSKETNLSLKNREIE